MLLCKRWRSVCQCFSCTHFYMIIWSHTHIHTNVEINLLIKSNLINFYYYYCYITPHYTITQCTYLSCKINLKKKNLKYKNANKTKGSANSRTDRQCEHDGGQCEFFLLCWMSSGLIQGICSGVLRGCCHRTAKSSNLGTEVSNQLFNLTNLPNKDFGPVVNDNSECPSILLLF